MTQTPQRIGLNTWRDPWIHVILKDASPAVVGLEEALLRAHEIRSLATGHPPAESWLRRVLYALALRVSAGGHLTDEARQRLWDSGSFDSESVRSYGEKWQDRFWISDPQYPWMQDPILPDQMTQSTGLDSLIVTRASKTSHTLLGFFHQDLHHPISQEEAALWLLFWHGYGAGGPLGPARTTPGGLKGFHGRVGPLRGRVAYYPEGQTLFESLVLGIPKVEGLTPSPEEDPAPWETSPPDPDGEVPEVNGPVSLILGRSQHALLLSTNTAGMVSDAWITWAWEKPLPQVDDPYVVMMTSQKGSRYFLYANRDRALFRDLESLLVHTKTSRRPSILSDFARLPGKALESCRVVAYLCDQETTRPIDHMWHRAETPAFLRVFCEDTAEIDELAEAVVACEEAARRLVWALDSAWNDVTGLDVKNSTWSVEGARKYWPAAERRFWRCVADRRLTEAQDAFAALAVAVYDDITRVSLSSSRRHVVRSAVQHRGKVASLLHTKDPA